MKLLCAILLASLLHVELLPQDSWVGANEITAGELFELSAPLVIRDELRRPFDLYMKTLQTGAPLPFPYAIESYTLKDGTINVVGRCTTGGMYEIPLGVFCYEDQVFLLPSWRVIVNEIPPVAVRAKDLLYPYPGQLLAVSSYNLRLQSSYDQQSFAVLASRLKMRFRIQLAFGCGFLCAVLFPILYRWYQIQRDSKGRAPQLPKRSLHEEFLLLSNKYSLGDRSSTILLEFLNLPCSSDAPKTSYELAQIYKQNGEEELARACSLIEGHGYVPQGEQYMDTVFNIIEARFGSAPP